MARPARPIGHLCSENQEPDQELDQVPDQEPSRGLDQEPDQEPSWSLDQESSVGQDCDQDSLNEIQDQASRWDSSVIYDQWTPELVNLPAPLWRPLLDARVGKEEDLQRYDWTTLFYDVWVHRQKLFLIGPPLLELEKFDLQVICNDQLLRLEKKKIISTMEKTVIWQALLPLSPLYQVKISFAKARLTLNLQDHAIDRPNQRLLITLQKNNELHWIADWIVWYSNYGIDRVIIYDNASAYQETFLNDLRQLLSNRLNGTTVKHITLVPWNVPFGMIVNFNHNNFFSQHGALNHAARCFAQRGDHLFNFDIDELLHCPSWSLDLLLKEHRLLYFDSYWVPLVKKLPDHFSFGSFTLREKKPRGAFPKWIVRWDDHARLCIHDVLGIRPTSVPISIAYYLHYKGISTRWKEAVYRDGKAKADIDQRYALAKPETLQPI